MKKNHIHFLLVGLIPLLIFSNCQQDSKRKVIHAFYHWKNSLELSTDATQKLQQLEVSKIYLRCFDVDWINGAPTPLSILNLKTEIADSIAIVPTVFITNRTMINLPDSDLPDLAKKILKKLDHISKKFSIGQITEMQFDCDWSQKSKQKYFYLLQLLKQELAKKNIKISATIRLHQIKYSKKTGIPDVDRGVLMFYNMDDIDDPKTPNSIINIELAKRYISNLDQYPLQLDLALPIFKWGLVFQEDKMVKIINNLSVSELEENEHFLKLEGNRFEVSKSTYLKGHYVYQKDQIKLEQVDIKVLREATDLLRKKIRNNDLNVIFYHLDSTQIADYSHEDLKDIYHRFY